MERYLLAMICLIATIGAAFLFVLLVGLIKEIYEN